MKFIITPLLSVLLFSAAAQQRQLVKIWESEPVIAVPESVLPDFKKGILYVSLIDGKGWDDDKKGGIGLLDMNGKNYNGGWITGLSAPKGMATRGKKLYTADMNRVVIINRKKGVISKTITMPSAENLNDVTARKGAIYVTDSKQGKIWKLKNNKPALYIENIKSSNGVKAIGSYLYYAEGGKLMRADKKKNVTMVGQVPQNIDGIEQLANGDFILTSWPGFIYYLDKSGNYQTLLDTQQKGINSADIGLDTKNNIIYVPTFNAKTVVAYQLR